MIISVLSLVVVNQSNSYIPSGLLQTYRLTLRNSSSPSRIVLDRQESGDSIRVKIVTTKPGQGSMYAGPTMVVADRSWTHGSTPSGLPLGGSVSYHPKSAIVKAGSYQEYATSSYYGTGFRDETSRGNLPANATDAAIIVERLCRFALAHVASHRLSEDGTINISGRSYSAFKASGTNTRYVDLSAWAQANDLVVNTGQDGTVKSFSKGGQLWIIPLAAAKIKKGSTWQTLPDLVMRKDGKYLIPVTAVQ